jgi:tetratricopeptide (TPR) repeat protein
MRSKTVEVFRKQIIQSSKIFSKAGDIYEARQLKGFRFRCRAWQLYLGFYLTRKPRIQKQLLEKSWRLTKQSLGVFDDEGNHIEFARTYDQLCTVVGLAFDFHWSPGVRGRRLKEGVEYGRQASKAVSSVDNKQLLARICARTALFFDAIGNEGSEIEHNEERDKEGLEYWKKAEHLDKDSALFQVGFPPGGFFRLVDEAESHRIHNGALEVARKVGDNFAIGWLLAQHAGWAFFDGIRAASPAESLESMMRSLRNAEEARRRQGLANFTSPNCGLMWSVSPYAEQFLALSWFQTDMEKRKLFVEKARRETPFLLRQARLSGYPQALPYADHVTSKILMTLAEYEPGPRRKLKLLRQALKHRVRACKITERIQPNDIHRNGTYISRLGEIWAAIADLQKSRRVKIRLLSLAVREKGRSVRFASEYTTIVSRGQPHLLQRLVGVDLVVYGDLIMRLYEVAEKDEILEKAAKAYTDAIGFLKSTTAFRRLGEAYWKAGEIYDRLGETLASAENFGAAAKTYETIAEKNPALGPLFLDYARYLEAWGNIEYARASHRRQAYDEAQKFYEKAAELHHSAGRWSFLAPYYTGLAKLELAENLSRRGQSPESISAFRDAAQLFSKSSVSLHKHANLLDQREERAMVDKIAGTFKEQYCLVRVIIEEARIAEDQGDYRTSADRFRKASELLEETAQKTISRREKNEFFYISSLSRAWHHLAQKTMMDPGEAFRDAAQQFEKSLDYCQDENARNLSLGHKYFCEALAASERFTYTLDPSFYGTATKYLTIASSHFANAGFSVQSTHAQACKMLLDAHALIARSSKDLDTPDRARHYEGARTLLHQAAEGFKRAHQTAKQQQVLGLIESVDEQYGLASRLAEISKTASNISPTVAFPAPARGEETPVGHSRFAGSGIDAGYGPSTSQDSQPGQEVSIELRVANIGSQPIRITKLKNILPDWARVVKAPSNAKVDRGSIILDQKRTDPMNVETFQITVHSRRRLMIVRPIILYSDENGREQSHELPVRILVGSPMLEHLAGEFMDDYKLKRLALDHCGWRTLMSIVESLKIPRSHVYGEPRWGRRRGRQLEDLINSRLVESRVFPGERGRGGRIVKVRLAYDQDLAKQYAEQITALGLGGSTTAGREG